MQEIQQQGTTIDHPLNNIMKDWEINFHNSGILFRGQSRQLANHEAENDLNREVWICRNKGSIMSHIFPSEVEVQSGSNRKI